MFRLMPKPVFYICTTICCLCLVIIIGGIISLKMYSSSQIVIVEDKMKLQGTGEKIELELKNKEDDSKVTYDVEDEEVVRVDDDGNLISVGEGTTEVTVSTSDGKKQTFVVEVDSDNSKTNSSTNSSDNSSSKNNSVNNSSSSSSKNNSTSNSSSNNNSTSNSSSNNNSSTNNNSTSNSSSSSSKNNSTNSSSSSSKIISVTGISVNKTNVEFNLNSNNITTTLVATVLPANATNKTVYWSSNNNNVATVNNGVVKAVGPGVASIFAKTADGNKVASTTVVVKKRVVIVIGASQVTRMAWYAGNYNSGNYSYNTNLGTLNYIHNSGSGMDYQTTDGFNAAKSIINNYGGVKNYVNFYIFFPLSGNTIKNFSCSQISSSNSSIKSYASNYNKVISSLKQSGFNVNGYVVSMHPVKVSQSNSNLVVTNQNSKSCNKNYRSNLKYYKFNCAMKDVVDTYGNLKYLSVFKNKIMIVNNEGNNYSYRIKYNTTDGVHWDQETTITYVNYMLGYSGDL